jgi:hypothetical protein
MKKLYLTNTEKSSFFILALMGLCPPYTNNTGLPPLIFAPSDLLTFPAS